MNERDIRNAVEDGARQYWDDAGQQSVAWQAWKDRNFEGECPQISQGSIVDYIHRSVMQAVRVALGHV